MLLILYQQSQMKKLLQMSVSIFTSCIRFLLSMEFLEELTLVVYSENFEHKEEIADEIVIHIIKQDKHLVSTFSDLGP